MPRNLAISRIYGVNEETVTDATVFLTPKVAHLYQWWHAHARQAPGGAPEGRLPLRREFDIADHPHIVPDLFLVEVLPGSGFLMKLEGERVIELFGVNNTGRIIAEGAGEEDFGHALAEYYRSVVEERRCRRTIGNLERMYDRHWIEFESIDCPLSRDGRRVDYIIGATVSVREKRL